MMNDPTNDISPPRKAASEQFATTFVWSAQLPVPETVEMAPSKDFSANFVKHVTLVTDNPQGGLLIPIK